MKENRYYYSAKTGGFYDSSEKSVYENSIKGWPADAVAITNDEYKLLFDWQAIGRVIVAGDDGKPYLAAPPEPTQEQLVASAEQHKQTLIDDAIQSINTIQLKLQAGRKLTIGETARLNVMLDYIDFVQGIDASMAPNIEWPEKP
ncbi:tail fiber assembly protein [uncultured Serratia sp.]|uniref:tail fiber assembly protein n=1 Tax=uncultured Serratia sp. TaxID=239175 RepID=UPI00258EB3DF|nr:tail fiber assembly protein [uncultured Serratia sp.]